MDLRLERDREGGLDIGLSGGKTVIVRQPPQINPVGWTFLPVEVEKTTISWTNEKRSKWSSMCTLCSGSNVDFELVFYSSRQMEIWFWLLFLPTTGILILWRRGWSWRWTYCQVKVNGCEAGNQHSGIYNSHNCTCFNGDTLGTEELNVFPPAYLLK